MGHFNQAPKAGSTGSGVFCPKVAHKLTDKLSRSKDILRPDTRGSVCSSHFPRMFYQMFGKKLFTQSGSTRLRLYLQKSKSNAKSLSRAVCLGPQAIFA